MTDTALREIVAVWQKRHGIDMSIKAATCAFEDAATAHFTISVYLKPQRDEMVRFCLWLDTQWGGKGVTSDYALRTVLSFEASQKKARDAPQTMSQQPVAAVDESLGDDTALTQVIKSAIENLGAPCGMGLCDDSQAQYVARKVIEHFSQRDTSRDEKLALIKYAIRFSHNRDYYSFEDILSGFEASQKKDS